MEAHTWVIILRSGTRSCSLKGATCVSQGVTLKEFYIDNCCSWRKKLQSAFGDDPIVYLDIFDAVKRFSEKIPKRNPLRRQCISEWQKVFRDSSDQGEKRHSLTSPPMTLHGEQPG